MPSEFSIILSGMILMPKLIESSADTLGIVKVSDSDNANTMANTNLKSFSLYVIFI